VIESKEENYLAISLPREPVSQNVLELNLSENPEFELMESKSSP